MKNENELTLDEIRALNAESSRILHETVKLIYEEKQLLKEEREKLKEEREKEKQLSKEEREKEKQLLKEDREKLKEEREQEKQLLQEEREKEKQLLQEEREKKKEEQLEYKNRMEDFDKKFKNTFEMIGGISRSNGEFCEEYFINSFKENPILFGEKFDRVIDYPKPDPMVINDEYDLVLRNGSTVALIEMKYKASVNDVGKMFSKLHSYRANFPLFKEYKTYLCLASFRFPKNVRVKADQEGIVLIEQRGEKIEIVSKNIKTW
jgi:flagellar motor protein MotB